MLNINQFSSRHMKISTNNKFLVVYLLIFVLGVLSLVYYNDVFVTKLKRDVADKIASSISLKKEVKYRSQHDLRWFNISEDEFFLNGDKIFTGEDSAITLETINKNQFSMDENSLIKLRDGLISLSKGYLTAFLNSKTSLFINGRKVLLDPRGTSVVNIKKIEGEGDVITVSEGTVFVEYEGQRIELKKNQVARIDSKSLILRAGLKNITLKTALYNGLIYCSHSMFEISWKSETPADKYKVRFFEDAFLKNKISEQILESNKYRFNATEFKKDIYVYIIGIKNGLEVSQLPPRRLQFLATDFFPDISMERNIVLKGNKAVVNDSKKINYLLSDSAYSLKAKNISTENITKYTTSIIDSSGLSVGKYDVNLCFSHPACSGGKICNKTRFAIRKGKLPTLKSPIAGKLITISQDKQEVSFAWYAPKGTDYKNLKLIVKNVLDNRHNIVEIKKYKVGNNNTTFKLREGRYSWHISGVDSDVEFRSPKSSFKLGKIVRPTELGNTFLDFSRRKMKFKFNWKQSDITNEKVILEIKSKGSVIKSILSINEKKKRRLQRTLPINNSIEWRLTGKRGGKQLYQTSWKTAHTPTCRGTNEVKLPNIYYQTNRSGKVVSAPRFTWPVVPGARSYLLKIFRFDQIEKVASFNIKTISNNYIWTDAIGKKMSWTITPIDITGKECITSSIGKYLKRN